MTKDRIENRPDIASTLQCYLCGQKIGDAEYQANEDGLACHFCCPPPEETAYTLPPVIQRLLESINDIGTQDIYTDASEYENRTGAMHELAALAGQIARHEPATVADVNTIMDGASDLAEDYDDNEDDPEEDDADADADNN
jgi:hypothetical protein